MVGGFYPPHNPWWRTVVFMLTMVMVVRCVCVAHISVLQILIKLPERLDLGGLDHVAGIVAEGIAFVGHHGRNLFVIERILKRRHRI